MNRPGLCMALLLGSGTLMLAQVPPPPGSAAPPPAQQPPGGPGGAPSAGLPAPAAIDPKLLAHLQQWERVMAGANSFVAKFTLKRVDNIRKITRNETGDIWCLKPNMARMRQERIPDPGTKADPKDFTTYICTGKAVYEYEGSSETVTEYPLRNPGVGENLLLEFMSGTLKANDVVQRFELTHLKPDDPEYVYLQIKPRWPKDKAEFEQMVLVLVGPKFGGLAYLPRLVEVRRQMGQVIETWDFPQPVLNAPNVKPEHFQYVPPDKGWKFKRAEPPPAATPPAGPGAPRVTRSGPPK